MNKVLAYFEKACYNIKRELRFVLILTHNLCYGFYIQKEVKIMNKYETIFIVNPNVAEEGTKSLIEKFSAIINNDGKVLDVEEMDDIVKVEDFLAFFKDKISSVKDEEQSELKERHNIC